MAESMVERVVQAMKTAAYTGEPSFERLARAAIEALREPTERMLQHACLDCSMEGAFLGQWRNAIDAALSDQEQAPHEKEPLRSLLERARNHIMTDEEIAAQRASWGRQDKD